MQPTGPENRLMFQSKGIKFKNMNKYKNEQIQPTTAKYVAGVL